MTHVRSIRSHFVRYPIAGGLRSAADSVDEKQLWLVFATGDDGNVGVGECWVESTYACTFMPRVKDFARELIELSVDAALTRMVDEQQHYADGHSRESLAALSGVDMALWDLRARSLGQPLHQVIRESMPHEIRTGDPHPVRCYASGGLYRPDDTVEDLVAEVLEFKRQGYDGFKVKVGGAELQHDVARVKAVREAIGPDAALMVDASSALTIEQAGEWLRALERFELTWFEEPLPVGAFEDQAKLRAESPIALCGYEGETGHDRVTRLIDDRCVDYLHIDLSICGGVSKSLEYIELAHEKDVPVTLHSAASAVLFLHNLHVATALNIDVLVESHMLHRWLHEHLPEGDLAVNDSAIRPPDRPGIGLHLFARDLQ